VSGGFNRRLEIVSRDEGRPGPVGLGGVAPSSRARSGRRERAATTFLATTFSVTTLVLRTTLSVTTTHFRVVFFEESMDDKTTIEPDEDNLGLPESADDSEGTDIADFEPPRRGPGRPRGATKNLGGEARQRAELVNALRRVALGKSRRVSASTGKQIFSAPTYDQQLRAAEILAGMSPDPSTPDVANVSEAELRQALAAYYVPTPPPRAIDPEPIEPVTDPSDGGVIAHITDRDEIEKFIAKQAKPQPADDENERRFPTGFSWRRVWDHATSKHQFHLFNPAGQHCGIRRDEARATKWCCDEGVIS